MNLDTKDRTLVQLELGAVRLWHRLGDSQRAREHLTRATSRVEALEQSAFRENLLGELALARLETEPSAFSERLLGEAKDYLERGGDRDREPELLLAQARYSRASGSAERVADLKKALRLATSLAASREVDEEGDHQMGRAIADDLIEEYVQRTDVEGIVATQQGVRARPAVHVRAARAEPPSDVVVLRYVSWRDNLALITGSSAERRFIQLKMGVAELSWLVSRYHLLLELGGQAREVERIEREMTEALLSPVAASLRGASELLVIPDGPIWNVPFPSLFSPIDPSARVGSTWALTIAREEALPPAWSASKPLSTALAVGYSPRGGTVAQLPFAEEEARSVASLYPTPLAQGSLKAPPGGMWFT
jgi:hypothetical protein